MTDLRPGVLYLVPTPIGNLEDITRRALRVLGEVDIVAAEDTRTARRLLGHFGIAAPEIVSLFEGNEAARAEELVARLVGGESVAVISEAGTPAISDPGQRLVGAAARAGIRVEALPGPSAVIAALVASGLPTARFAFFGFPPREVGARHELFGTLRREPHTVILFESPERVATTLADLEAAFGPDRPAALARELTKLHEEVVRGTLSELRARAEASPPRGECTLVIGGAPAGVEPELDLEARVRELLASGLGPKDVAARLVSITGKPRRAIYQLALSLQRERDQPE